MKMEQERTRGGKGGNGEENQAGAKSATAMIEGRRAEGWRIG